MLRISIILIAFTLAACAPVVVPAGELLPVEAQRLIDRATATAAGAATQAANATAAARSTREALAVEATRAGISLTQSAAQVQSTDAASIKTQAAAQTSAYATPTWAAIQTHAALDRAGVVATATAIAASSERTAASARLATGVAQAVIIGALLAGLAMAAVTAWWANERQRIRTDAYRELQWQQVAQAEAETERARAELIRACMIERAGAPWLLTPKGLLPMLPGGQVVQSENNRAREWRWRAAIKRAVFAGVAAGAGGKPEFGERALAGPWVVNPDGTPSSAGYRKISRLLRRAGVWITAGRDTTWGPGWSEERFEREFDRIPLPDLPAGEPPNVLIPSRSSAVSAVAAVPHSSELVETTP